MLRPAPIPPPPRARSLRAAPAVAVAAALASSLHARTASADASVYPAGKIIRAANERAVVVWERARRVEHIVRQLDVEGEAPAFAMLVATPSEPTVSKVKDDPFKRVGALVADVVPPPPAPEATPLPVSKLDDFEVKTVKATEPAELQELLAKSKLEVRPLVSTWIQKVATKGWYITALRFSGAPAGARTIKTPAVRFTFDTDSPIYPYMEAPPTRAEQQDFSAGHPGFRSTSQSRVLDVWFAGDDPMTSFQRLAPSNPPPYGVAHATGDALATALGDTKAWGLEPKGLPDWTLTHFHEASFRFAVDDIAFRPQDARAHTTFDADGGAAPPDPAAAGADATPPARPSRPAIDRPASRGPRGEASPAARSRAGARKFVFGVAALAVLGGLLFAAREMRNRSS